MQSVKMCLLMVYWITQCQRCWSAGLEKENARLVEAGKRYLDLQQQLEQLKLQNDQFLAEGNAIPCQSLITHVSGSEIAARAECRHGQ
jgi:hypothetical protein